MRLITLRNQCHPVRGFVYTGARFSPDRTPLDVHVRPRRGSATRCSGCQQVAPGYDQLAERRFAFIPVWGFLVVLLYRMRRVQCKTCGIVVEAVPWASGKHHLTNVYMQFLAHWARRLSWQETADAFRTSWAQVGHAVEVRRDLGAGASHLEPDDRHRRG
jgi:transposase